MANRTGLFERFLGAVFQSWYVGLPLGILSLAFGIYSFSGAREQAVAAENWFRAGRVYVLPVCLTLLGCCLGYVGLGNLFGWFREDEPRDGPPDAAPGTSIVDTSPSE